MSNIWADEPELVTRLIDLWNKGFSASQISRQFRGKVSRSGVAGKIDRLRKDGIQLREAVRVQRVYIRALPNIPNSAPLAIGPIENFPDSRSNGCRHIAMDPTKEGWRTCGNEGYPFCEYHRAVCYIPPEKKHADQSS